MGLQMPSEAGHRIAAEVSEYGASELETGFFLLARNDDPDAVDVLALCGTAGVSRHALQFTITGRAMAVLFEWAEASGLRVVAQVHSHLFHARMSPTDERFGLTVTGFRSAIVPNAAHASGRPSDWGWWQFGRGRWDRSLAPTAVDDLRSRVVQFDEAGVRG